MIFFLTRKILTSTPVVDEKCPIFYKWGALVVCHVFAKVLIKNFCMRCLSSKSFLFLSLPPFCTVYLSLGILKCWQSFPDSSLEGVFASNRVVHLMLLCLVAFQFVVQKRWIILRKFDFGF